MMPQPPKMKYTPHKVLVSGTSFLSVADSDCVLEVHLDVNKVTRVFDDKGQPAQTPDGQPIYFFQHSVRAVVLSKEEWQVKKQLMENGE